MTGYVHLQCCDALLQRSKTAVEFKGLLAEFSKLADILNSDLEEGKK